MKNILYGKLTSDPGPDYIVGGCELSPDSPQWGCACEEESALKVKFQIIVDDITTLNVDAIVNAANSQLERGGGVCGAIYRAAGRELDAECSVRFPNGIATGEAVATKGYNSKAKWIIHAVAPRSKGNGDGDHLKLSNAYRNALLAADEVGARSIAFPSLGTGIYAWDVQIAAPYALHDGLRSTFNELKNITTVILCCFSEEDKRIYETFA